VRQLVSKALTTDGQVIDGFLAEVRGLKHKNVAAELLEKLLKDERKVSLKRNLVQSQLTNFLWVKTSLDAAMCLGFYPSQP